MKPGLLCAILVFVLLVYGTITWHVFGVSFSSLDSGSGSGLGDAGDSGGSVEDGQDSLDHFLESILIEGFPTHLTKKEKKPAATANSADQPSAELTGSFHKPRLRGT